MNEVNLTLDKKTTTTVNHYNNNAITTVVSFNSVQVNSKPILSDFTITMDWNTEYTFTNNDILNNYTHSNSANPLFIKIEEIVVKGVLKLNNQPVIQGQIIPYSQWNTVKFVPTENGSGLNYTTCKISISSDSTPSNPYSEVATIKFDVIGDTLPTVNDVEVTIDWNEGYVITLADVTDGYLDLENEPFSHIIIDSIQGSGKLQLNGQDVTYPLQVSRSQIEASQLVYVDDINVVAQTQLVINFTPYDE